MWFPDSCAPHRHGVQVKLVLRLPPCIPCPSYRAGVGTAAEGAPRVSWAHWEVGHQALVLRLLQGPGSGGNPPAAPGLWALLLK